MVFHVEPRLPLVATTDKHLASIVHINRSEERRTVAFQAVDVAGSAIRVDLHPLGICFRVLPRHLPITLDEGRVFCHRVSWVVTGLVMPGVSATFVITNNVHGPIRRYSNVTPPPKGSCCNGSKLPHPLQLTVFIDLSYNKVGRVFYASTEYVIFVNTQLSGV